MKPKIQSQNWILGIRHWDFIGNWKLEIGNLYRYQKPKSYAHLRGFTLTEMLVSVSIFLIFTTISLGIYTSTVRAEKKVLSLARVQQEAQFVMEFLAKMIRTSEIDYAAYPGGTIPSPTTQFILRNASGDQYVFNYVPATKAVTVSVNAQPARQISSTLISITDLNYYITPATTPYPGGGQPPVGQPRATIVMRFSSTALYQPAQMLVQQTVPQRSVD